MTCKKCNANLESDAKFCPVCGAKAEEYTIPPAEKLTPPAAPVVPPVVTPVINLNERKEITEAELPEKFKPLGAWSYFWLSILFSIPVVGFIFLMIFTFSDGNRNRRSFARSYWCGLLILAIIFSVYLILALAIGGSMISAFRY